MNCLTLSVKALKLIQEPLSCLGIIQFIRRETIILIEA